MLPARYDDDDDDEIYSKLTTLPNSSLLKIKKCY